MLEIIKRREGLLARYPMLRRAAENVGVVSLQVELYAEGVATEEETLNEAVGSLYAHLAAYERMVVANNVRRSMGMPETKMPPASGLLSADKTAEELAAEFVAAGPLAAKVDFKVGYKKAGIMRDDEPDEPVLDDITATHFVQTNLGRTKFTPRFGPGGQLLSYELTYGAPGAPQPAAEVTMTTNGPVNAAGPGNKLGEPDGFSAAELEEYGEAMWRQHPADPNDEGLRSAELMDASIASEWIRQHTRRAAAGGGSDDDAAFVVSVAAEGGPFTAAVASARAGLGKFASVLNGLRTGQKNS